MRTWTKIAYGERVQGQGFLHPPASALATEDCANRTTQPISGPAIQSVNANEFKIFTLDPEPLGCMCCSINLSMFSSLCLSMCPPSNNLAGFLHSSSGSRYYCSTPSHSQQQSPNKMNSNLNKHESKQHLVTLLPGGK